jgi:hypothetical protein
VEGAHGLRAPRDQRGVPIVPFASVGVEDMFEIVLDAEDLLASLR